MTSPAPDAAALDSKPAPAKEQKETTNGLSTNESKAEAEAQAEVKTKSESDPNSLKIESRPESKTISETKQPSPKSEELVINGRSSPDEATTNGDGAKKGSPEINDVAVTKTEEKSEEEKPEKPTEDHNQNQKDADESVEEADKIDKIEEAEKAEKAEEVEKVEKIEKIEDTRETEQPDTSQTEDVQMTDATNENETPELTRDDKSSKPSPESQSPPAEPGEDKVMTDSVMIEKPTEKDVKEVKETQDTEDAKDAKDASAQDATPPPEAKQSGASSVETSIEVSMGDAPSSKVSREREDENGDEPAAKRAKTEPKEEEPTASTAGTPAPAADTAISLSSLSKWEDEETDKKPITMHQRREIRKTIARVKKTKHGGHFRDAVPKLWPHLSETYLARIEKPMDLSEIDRNIRDPTGIYVTFGDMRKALSLIFENTMTFNGPSHDVTASALNAIRAVWHEAIGLPEEEPTRPKRQSSGPVSSPPPREVPEPKPRPPPPAVSQEPSSAAADRRGSTATEADRPKRTVRAPKPKDIDYTKPSRKKLKPELQFCEEVLSELMHHRNHDLNSWFMKPVDAQGLNIPQYYSTIKKPMDLEKVSRLLSSGEFSNLKEFDRTVRLIIANCYQFNGPPDQGNPVSLVAKKLEDLYNQQMKGKDAWLARYAKAKAPAASHGSDEDEEEDSDDGGDAPVPSVDYAKEVQEYSAKLEEESKKLNSLFATGADSSAVDCQRVVVEALQKALYNAAQGVKDAKPSKRDKASKKSSKPSKSKTSSSSHPPHRKSLSGPPSAKKPSVTKKPAPKKNLSAADKDAIASAINDLEAQDLDRAIDIIKRDTGQNENNEGELELDIDQLSNEALFKLWDLLRKVLPGFGKSSAPAKSEAAKAAPSKSTPKTASKPKKNKPMSAQEQESRIDQLKAIRELYKSGQDPSDNAANEESPNADDSSDDSDSEEE